MMTSPNAGGNRISGVKHVLASHKGAQGHAFEPIVVTLPPVGGVYAWIDGRLHLDGVALPVRSGR